MKKITSILAILSLIFSPVTPAFAATYYWDTASTVDWETGWSFNPVSGGAGAGFPDVADMAVFNQSAVNGWTGPQLWGNYAVAGMTIKNTGTTLIDSNSAPTRNLSIGTGGITVDAGAGAVTIGWSDQPLNITLAGAQAWTNNSSNILTIVNNIANGANLLTVAGSGDTALNGVLGGGAGDLAKTGAGTLTLSGTNTYTGTTTVTAGTLLTIKAAALPGYGSAGKVVFSGGTVGVRVGGGGWTTGEVDTLLTNATKTSGTLAIDTTNGGLAQWAAFTTANFGPALGLTKLGANTLTLGQANTYTGVTMLNAGTLNLGVAEVAGTSGPLGQSVAADPGSIVLNGGILQYSASNQNDYSGRFSTAASQQYNVDTNGQNVTWATGLTSPGGSLTKTGTGALTLSNTETYTGATTVSSGILAVNGDIRTSSLTTVQSGATIKGTGTTGALTVNGNLSPGNSPGTLSSVGTVTFAPGGAYIWEINNATGAQGTNWDALVITGALDITATSGSRFAIDITGLTLLNAVGVVPNFNKYLPYTWTIASATAGITGFAANKFTLDSSAFTNNNSITGSVSPGVFGITTSGNNLQLTYTGAVGAPATAYWKDTQGSELWNTNVAGSTNWTTTSGGGVDTGLIPGVITDVHFYATGAGAFATNMGQDFTINSLTMDGGTANNAVSISGNTLTINGASGITMNSGAGMLTLNSNVLLGGAQTWLNNSSNLLTVAGNVNNGALLLTVDGTGNTAISGVISNGALTKTGTGILKLSGPNTYNGTTTLSNGILQIGVNSVGAVGSITSSAVGTGALALNGGTISSDSATARTILNAVTLGGNVALGDATNTGKLTFSAATNLGGATRILTTASDAEFDGVVSNGGLTKSGTGTLTLAGNNSYAGATSINAGKLTITSATGLGTTAGGVSVANGATLDLNGTFDVGNEAVTLADGSALSSSAGTNSISGAIGVTGTSTVNVATSLTLSGAITCGLGYPHNLIDKTGAGILVLSGNADNYALSATVDAGTLSLEKTSINALADLIVNAGTARLNGTDDKQLWDGGKVTLNGGILDMNAHNETIGSLAGTAGTVTNNATGTATLTAGADNLSSAFSGTLQDGGSGKVLALGKTGSGVLSLSGANSYSGGTALNAGSLSFANGSLGSSGIVEFKANSTLQWAAGNVQDISSRIKIDDGVTASLDTQANNVTFANAFQTGTLGTGGFTKAGSGILELAGANVHTGTTRINAGTVLVGNANAFGSGAVINNASLDLGTTNTTVGGVYTQNSGSTLKLIVNSSTDHGKITTPSAAVVNSGSSVYVTVGGFIPNNAVLKIIDTGSAGITLAGAGTSPTVNSSNSKVNFLASVLNNDLVLTANREATGYAPAATTPDSKAVATVLDNMTNPSSDMTTVLNILDGLTSAQTAAALNTMVPDSSGFNPQVPVTLMEQFVGVQMDHLGGVAEVALGHAAPQTGMSAGDQPDPYATWFKAFGTSAHQGPRGTSQGYNLSNGGGAIGIEKDFSCAFKAGLAVGNSRSWVRGKDNASRTNIDTTQVSLYGGYKPVTSPWYLNGALSYNYSTYGGSREIHISSSDNRIANAHYRGHLFGASLETGYGIKLGKKAVLTPLASLSYSRLHVPKYSEADAGALDLNVDSQDYDNLRSGFGGKLETGKEYSFGKVTPEVHAKYLYDIIADRQSMVASFAGGGTAFAVEGYKPARSGANVGTSLTLATKKNVTLSLRYDLEVRQDYYAHTGFLNVAYKF